jgi:hypothetical protein
LPVDSNRGRVEHDDAAPRFDGGARVTRDSLLFLLIGLLAGFLVGYISHEAMTEVQPARMAGGTQLAATTAGPPAAGGGAPGGAPAMAEINRLRALVEQNPNDLDALRQLANLNYDIANWPRAGSERYLEPTGNPT